MRKYDKESLETELKDCLREMKVPENRTDCTDHNLRWILRNLGIKNSEHEKFHRAIYITKFLIHMK